MTISLLISLFVPLLLGYFFICLFWPGAKAINKNLLFKISLAIGLGLGISSSIFFIWLIIFGPSINGFVITEIAFLICLIAIVVYKIKERNQVVYAEHLIFSLEKPAAHRILYVCFYILLISAIVSFIIVSVKNPHGGWDAWATWNMKARFIFRGGYHWKEGFLSFGERSHPDYPLLIPGIIARCWMYIGKETLIVPVCISMFFTFATVGLIISSLSIIGSKTQGILAGIVLLGTPFFIEHGASQYADVPLGFFFLTTIILFHLQERLSENNFNLLFLAGITSGLSLWTKNEGFLFIMFIIVSRFIVFIPLKDGKRLRRILSFTKGVLPISVMIFYFRTQLLTSHSSLNNPGFHTIMARLLDFSRYLLVGKEIVNQIIHFGGIAIFLIIYLLISGINIEEKERANIAASVVILSLMMAGYILFYIVYPQNLPHYLRYSLNRLLLQLWPSFLFVFFLVARAKNS